MNQPACFLTFVGVVSLTRDRLTSEYAGVFEQLNHPPGTVTSVARLGLTEAAKQEAE